MAIHNGDVEEAPREIGATMKQRNSHDSTYKSTEGSNSNSNFNSKNISLTMPVDSSVLEMVSAVRDDIASDDGSQQRKSQLCCFFCCDLRKACIIMNATHIFIELMHLLSSLLPTPSIFGLHIELYDVVYDDDNIAPEMQMETLDPWAVVGYTKLGLGMIFALVGIFGARNFSKNMVLCSGIYNCCYILASGIHQEWAGFFVPMPFAYTNFHLYLALKNNNISRENYVTEAHCCCGRDSE